jgi:hypothetical protein
MTLLGRWASVRYRQLMGHFNERCLLCADADDAPDLMPARSQGLQEVQSVNVDLDSGIATVQAS